MSVYPTCALIYRHTFVICLSVVYITSFHICVVCSYFLLLEISLFKCVEEGQSDEKARAAANKELEALHTKVHCYY